MVDIIIPTYGQEKFTAKCFHTITENTRVDNRIIWVDNGSSEESRKIALQALESHPNYLTIWSDENLGFVKGVNLGLSASMDVVPNAARFVVIMNNDTEASPGWLSRMIDLLEANQSLGAVGPVTSNKHASPQWWKEAYRVSGNAVLPTNFDGLSLESKSSFLHSRYAGKFHQVPMVAFFCTLFKAEIFRSIGVLDEIFGMGLGDDDDYCYDKETQIVTREGIKYIKDVTLDDELLTMNDEGRMSWQHPSRVISKHEEKMLHFKTRRLDMMVSRDQDLLIGYQHRSKGIDKPLDFIRADHLNEKLWPRQGRYYVKKNGGSWDGEEHDTIIIDGKSFNMFWFVKFLAWYLSEGHCEAKCDAIRITQYYCENRDQILEILNHLEVSYTETDQGYYIHAGSGLCDYCRKFGKSNEKYIPDEIKALPPYYLAAFLESYRRGDGTDKGNGGESYFTSSDKMRDDLVELLLKTGRTFSFSKQGGGKTVFSNGEYHCSPCWHIQSYQKNQERALIQPARLIDYHDEVYDVTVPNRRIYVIRNGKGCWSSNCKRMLDVGFNIGICLDSYVEHNHRTTFKAAFGKNQIKVMQQKNRALLQEKHGNK